MNYLVLPTHSILAYQYDIKFQIICALFRGYDVLIDIDAPPMTLLPTSVKKSGPVLVDSAVISTEPDPVERI